MTWYYYLTLFLGDLRSEEQLIYLKLQLRQLTADIKDQEVTIISTVNVYGVDKVYKVGTMRIMHLALKKPRSTNQIQQNKSA